MQSCFNYNTISYFYLFLIKFNVQTDHFEILITLFEEKKKKYIYIYIYMVLKVKTCNIRNTNVFLSAWKIYITVSLEDVEVWLSAILLF